MKNLIKSLALAALCVASFSCAKNETFVKKTSDIHFSLRTAESKTYIVENGDKYSPMWNKGDQIGVILEEPSADNGRAGHLTNEYENGATADFCGTINDALEEGTIYAFYPNSAYEKVYSDNTVGLNLPSLQHPSAVSFDPKADILVARPVEYIAIEKEVALENLNFARVVALLKVNLNSDFAGIKDDVVKKFTLTASGATLSGRMAVDLIGGEATISDWTLKAEAVSAFYDENNVVKVAATSGSNSVYLLVGANTVAKGTKLTFAIEGTKYNAAKDVTLSEDLVLNPGKLKEINLNLAEANCEEIKAETRILVEGFDNVTAQSQASADKTGVTGTGVTDNLTYTYSTSNTNIRVNGNGHGSGNPFLWISGAGQYLQIGKIAVSNETDLKFSCQVRTTQGTADVTLKYKASSDQDWSTASGKISATTSSINDVQSLIFSISSEVTSLDLQIVGSAGSLVVDDIVLEKFVDERVALTVPANVAAEVDANIANKINVTWETVENAGSYEVTLQATGEQDVVETVETNSISFTGLEYSTEYSVKVKAITSDISKYKDSEYSAAVKVTTGEKPAVMIYFKKITSESQMVDDAEYLIVHATDAIFDGSRGKDNIDGAANYIEITSSDVTADGISYDTYKEYCVYVASVEGGYSFKTKGGVYFGRTSDSNGYNTSEKDPIVSTLTFGDGGAVVIKGTGTSTKAFGFVSSKFRFYAASNAKDIYLYMKDDPRTALATPVITLTPDSEAKTIKAEWEVVSGAANYTVSCTGKTDVTTAETSCTFTELAAGEYTVTVTANPSNTTANKPSSASKTAKIEPGTSGSYASLAALVADGAPTSTARNVTVTLTNEEIKSIFTTSKGERRGIYLQATADRQVEIYCATAMPDPYAVGGTVSGTLVNAKWILFNSTWELEVANWTELTYTAPSPKCETPVITLNGAQASITCATEGATILYEISDSEPASFTKTYSGAVTLTDGQTIWAKAFKTNYRESDVASKKYVAGGAVTKAASKEWDLTAVSSDWVSSGNVTYFSQPYGYKKANCTLTCKSIADFTAENITKIECGFKCLQNGANTTKITIYLVDKNGGALGDGVELTPVNASAASKTEYVMATFDNVPSGATGFMMKITTFGKNVLVNGAKYTVHHSTDEN